MEDVDSEIFGRNKEMRLFGGTFFVKFEAVLKMRPKA